MRILLILFLSFLTAPIFSQKKELREGTSEKPFILGLIDEIQSNILSEKRILNIYLPEGYDPNDSIRYPVVYLLDGSADEDFIHVVGLYQFNNFSWIDRVPKSIIVGIANTDRKRDFTFPSTLKSDIKLCPGSGKSEFFIRFLEKELQPYIEQKYKANSSKTIIGQSLGGLLATEILFKNPALFTSYIIISPSIWWNDGSLLKYNFKIQENTKGINVYIGVGKEGLAPSEFPHVMEVDANLLAEKIKASSSKKVNVYFDYLPEENHATITHQAIFNALRALHPISSEKK